MPQVSERKQGVSSRVREHEAKWKTVTLPHLAAMCLRHAPTMRSVGLSSCDMYNGLKLILQLP